MLAVTDSHNACVWAQLCGQIILVINLGDERERLALSQEGYVRLRGWVEMARKVVVWERDGEAGSAECYAPHQGPARAYLSQIQLLGLHILLCCSYPSPLLGMQGWEEGLTARVLLPGRICFSSVFSQKIIVSEVQRKLLLKSSRHSTAPPYQREPCGWSSQLQISGIWV